MEFPPAVTLGTLFVFLLVAFVPPRVPLWARLLVQAVLAAFIYLHYSDAMFALPDGDTLPISDLSGGSPVGGFAPLSMGFIAFALGALVSLLVAGIKRLRSKPADPA